MTDQKTQNPFSFPATGRETCPQCEGAGTGADGWDCLACEGDGWVFNPKAVQPEGTPE